MSHSKLLLLLLALVGFSIAGIRLAPQVEAGSEACGSGYACWSTRSIAQHSCRACSAWELRCSGRNLPAGATCNGGSQNCTVYGGQCINVCINWGSSNDACVPTYEAASCNTSTGNCQATVNATSCVIQSGACQVTSQWTTLGCCEAVSGPGPTGGPGSTPPPPTPTPPPTDPPGCNTFPFQYGTAPATVQMGQTVQVACNFQNVVDCINPVWWTADSPWSTCTWSHFNGTDAVYNCTAKSTPGVYTHYCQTRSGTAANCCPQQMPAAQVQILSPTCTISSLNPNPGTTIAYLEQTMTLTPTVNVTNGGSVTAVNYWSANTGIATVSPASVYSSPFSTVVTPQSMGGPVRIYARAAVTGGQTCDGFVDMTSIRPTFEIESRIYQNTNISQRTTPYSPGFTGTINFVNTSTGGITSVPVSTGNSVNTISVPGVYGYLASLSITSADWVLVSPAVNQISIAPFITSWVGVPPDPAPNAVEFWVERIRSPWWQTVGGDVGANGSPISDTISDLATSPYISLRRTDPTTALAPGVVSLPNYNNISLTPGAAVSDLGWRANNSVDLTIRKEDYGYFWRLMEMRSGSDDFPSRTMSGWPGGSPSNGPAFFSDGPLTISTSLPVVPNGTRYTIFVNGKLTIDDDVLIRVANGGFVAFIVNGDIEFSGGVGSPNAPGIPPLAGSMAIEGVYIADGMITVMNAAVNPKQFTAAGIFAGWGGIEINRELNGLENNTNPAAVFQYRPDLVINAPDEFKRFNYTWQEVAP